MPETHVPITITVDGVEHVFNDFETQDHLRVEEFEIRKPLRYEEEPMPQRDGVLVPTHIFRGGAYPTLRGIIDPGASLEQRATRMDQIEGLAEALRHTAGVLRWTPTGKPQRRMTVRLTEDLPVRTRGIVAEWDLMLVSSDPLEYEETLNQAITSELEDAFGEGQFSFPYSYPYSYGSATLGGEVIVTPGGTADVFPFLSLVGPITSPRLTNVTTGESIYFPGLVVPDGQALEVSTRGETALLNGSVDVLHYIDWVSSSLWSLRKGVSNTVRVSGTGFDAGTLLSVLWRNAYA